MKDAMMTSTTGGMKNQRKARFDLVPWDVIWALSEHYGNTSGPGTEYEERNWEKGVPMSLSFAALMRHLVDFFQNGNREDEKGNNNLAAVMFHTATLMRVDDKFPELDDRPCHPTEDPFA